MFNKKYNNIHIYSIINVIIFRILGTEKKNDKLNNIKNFLSIWYLYLIWNLFIYGA